MPSGRTHDALTWMGAIPLAGLVLALTHSAPDALWVGGGALVGGLWLSPDLDVRSRPYYRWGPLRWIWWPYQRLFSHRSVWTHGLVPGPAVRLLYLGLVMGLAWAIARLWLPTLPAPSLALAGAWSARWPLRTWELALLGVWAGAALHTGADLLVSGLRRLGRRR